MLIPLKIEAARYHPPVGTLAAVAANLLVFFVAGAGAGAVHFGVLRPWEWLTHAFGHADLVHLFFNMVFLWFFGQIVEGRLGWSRFIPLYLALAVAEGLLVQVLMLGAAGGGAIGASGAIYALMVMAVVWSPEDRIHCLLLWFPYVRVVEVRVLSLGLLYVVTDLVGALLLGFAISTPVLHLLGAGLGLGPALLLPRLRLVHPGDWNGLTRSPEVEEWREAERERRRRRRRPPTPAAPPPDLPPLELPAEDEVRGPGPIRP